MQVVLPREVALERVGERLAVTQRTARIDHQHGIAARGPDLGHDGEVGAPRQVRAAVQPQDQWQLCLGRHAGRTHQPGLPALSGPRRGEPELLDRSDRALVQPRRFVRQHRVEPAVRAQQCHFVGARATAPQARDAAVACHRQALDVERIARAGAAADVAVERLPLPVQAHARETTGALVRQQREQAGAVRQPLQALVDVQTIGVRQRDDLAAMPRHHVHDARLEGFAPVAIADERDPAAVGRDGGAADRAAEFGQAAHRAIRHVELVDVGIDDRARVQRAGLCGLALHRHHDVAAVGRPRDAAGESELGDVDQRAAMLVRAVGQLPEFAGGKREQEDVVIPVRLVAVAAFDAPDQLLAVDAGGAPLWRAQLLPGRGGNRGGRGRHPLDERETAAIGRPREGAGRLVQPHERWRLATAGEPALDREPALHRGDESHAHAVGRPARLAAATELDVDT